MQTYPRTPAEEHSYNTEREARISSELKIGTEDRSRFNWDVREVGKNEKN
ncbi:MAG: hypothetical protein ACE5R6_02425 [Candidatus Heimdallarchaeota archaeon]